MKLRIRDALWIECILSLADFIVEVVAGNHDCLEPLVVFVVLNAVDIETVTIPVVIDAEEAAVFIYLDLLNCGRRRSRLWVKLSIVGLCALVVRQNPFE